MEREHEVTLNGKKYEVVYQDEFSQKMIELVGSEEYFEHVLPVITKIFTPTNDKLINRLLREVQSKVNPT